MVTDERVFNFRRSPSLFRKLRKLVTNNKTGDVYGMTIPKEIAFEYHNCFFSIRTSGTSIILESGCGHIKKEEPIKVIV